MKVLGVMAVVAVICAGAYIGAGIPVVCKVAVALLGGGSGLLIGGAIIGDASSAMLVAGASACIGAVMTP